MANGIGKNFNELLRLNYGNRVPDISTGAKRSVNDNDINSMYSIYIKYFNENAETNSEQLNIELLKYIIDNNLDVTLENIKSQLKTRYESEQSASKSEGKTESGLTNYLDDIYDSTFKSSNNNVKELLPEGLNELYDESTIKFIAENLDIDKSDVTTMLFELAQIASEKGVEATDYISARLVDFLQMRTENPNMSLDEMNKELALNNILESGLNSLVPTVSELFSTDITSFDDLLDMQKWELMLTDEYPQAREAYVQTSRMTYLSLAQSGDLTKGDYYQLIKDDLANIFPNYREMDDAAKDALKSKINSLSIQEVEDFINRAISLPGCYQDDYGKALNEFMSEFYKTTNEKTTYNLKNADEIMNLSKVYNSMSGVEFNADSIIDANIRLEKIEDAINESVTYQTALNIFDAVKNGEKDEGSALWQIGYLYTSSTDEEDILAFLKGITGNENLTIENNRVVTSSEQRARTRGAFQQDDNQKSALDTVADWCKSAWQSIVNLIESESVQQIEANADFTSIEGWCNYIGELLTSGDFYKDTANLGMIFLGGAELKAATTAGSNTLAYLANNAGIGLNEMIMGASYAGGAVLDFIQNPDTSYNGITNFVAELMEGGNTILGGKYINAAFEAPAVVKGAWNNITSTLSNKLNNLSFLKICITKQINKSYFDADDIEQINIIKDAIKNGKLFEKNPYYDPCHPGFNKGTKFASENPGTWIKISDDIKAYLKTVIDDIDDMPKNLIEGIKYRKNRALSNGYNLLEKKYTDDELMQILIKKHSSSSFDKDFNLKLAREEFQRIKQEVEYIKAIKEYAKAHKTTVPMKLVRGEQPDLISKIEIEGKSLSKWIDECSNKNDYSELLNILNKGESSYTLERAAGTSILGNGLDASVVRWNINAPAGTEGVFADFISSHHNLEWEFILSEGTKLNINNATLQGNYLILNATVEVVTNTGQTITKKVAIAVGTIAGSATAANAQNPTPPPTQPTGDSNPQPDTNPTNPNDNNNNGVNNPPPTGNDNPPPPSNHDNNDDDDGKTPKGGTNPDDMPNKPPQDNPNDGVKNPDGSKPNGNNDDGKNPSDGNDESGIPWGPGHPDYDALYGDLDPDLGGDINPNPNVTIDTGSFDYSKWIFGNTSPSIEGANKNWYSWTPEERANWIRNYVSQLLQEKYGIIDGINIDVNVNSNGIVTFNVSADSMSLLNSNIPEIENWLNGVANDSSNDIASLSGVPNGSYTNDDTDVSDSTSKQKTQPIKDNNGNQIGTVYYNEDGTSIERVEVTLPDGTKQTTYGDEHREIEKTDNKTGIIYKYTFDSNGKEVLLKATNANGEDVTEKYRKDFNQASAINSVLNDITNGKYGQGSTWNRTAALNALKEAGADVLSFNKLTPEEVYNKIVSCIKNGDSWDDIYKKLQSAENNRGGDGSGNGSNYGQTGGQSFGLGDQGFNDVFGNNGYSEGYHMDFWGNWVPNGSGYSNTIGGGVGSGSITHY